MSLIKILGPVIDIYCGLNQITIEFHLAREFFDPWAPFFSEHRAPPLPAPGRLCSPARCQTVVILNTQNISVLHSGGPSITLRGDSI